jgi:hypothetical protein
MSHSSSFPKLCKRKDWAGWKFIVTNRLKSECLFEIVNGTEVCPTQPEQIATWNRRNSRAIEIIGCSLGPDYLSHVVSCDKADIIWTLLCGLCEVNDPAFVHVLQQRFFYYKFNSTIPMQEYIADLKKIANDCWCCGNRRADHRKALARFAKVV